MEAVGAEGRKLDGKVVEIPVNDKYVVLRRYTKTGELMLRPIPNMDAHYIPPAAVVKDAVVIRLQDVFAQSALWTYANEIRAALEVIAVMGVGVEDSPMVARLHEIADYFERMSYLAGTIEGRKVPD